MLRFLAHLDSLGLPPHPCAIFATSVPASTLQTFPVGEACRRPYGKAAPMSTGATAPYSSVKPVSPPFVDKPCRQFP